MTYETLKSDLKSSYVLILAGSLYFIGSSLTPVNNGFFNSSTNYPTGIFTSLFLYDGWSNILLFVLCLVLFVISSYRFPIEYVKRRSEFSTISMFMIAVFANIYWVYEFPLRSGYGQSGVMFAFYGIVFAFCIAHFGLVMDYVRQVSHDAGKSEKLKALSSVLSVILGFFIFFQIILEKGQFLNEVSGVAYQIHAFAFFIGMIFGIIFDTIERQKFSPDKNNHHLSRPKQPSGFSIIVIAIALSFIICGLAMTIAYGILGIVSSFYASFFMVVVGSFVALTLVIAELLERYPKKNDPKRDFFEQVALLTMTWILLFFFVSTGIYVLIKVSGSTSISSISYLLAFLIAVMGGSVFWMVENVTKATIGVWKRNN